MNHMNKQATRTPCQFRQFRQFRRQALALEISRAFGATAMLAAVPLALAAPQGGTVTAGQASIQNSGALTTITQGSQRAAIDWRSFNVGANETVNFVQPNASAAILNRVVGNDPSAIFGRITANGQVLLINPNGILFGRTAQVDVGALTATTSNLSNADFMAGRLHFTEPGKPGATVENQGRITVAEGGFAALVGRQVANSGVITARLGKVALAGGDAFVLDLYGDKLVNLIVDPAAMGALTDAQGQPLAARVDHSGEIVADGGRVQLSVATVRQLVDNLINLSGVVRATSFTQAQGVISLHGDANTRVAVSGTLDTSGEQRGGRIEATGRDVELQPGARLAATGGQGSIAVGGDWQGQGTLAHAEQVNVAQGASLDASGGVSGGGQGQGGTVVLWSDRRTQFAGRIAASGGTAGGDAGQVEVSSKGLLGFQGEVDVFAANGKQGSLLLDPANLTIAATSIGDSQISADQLRFFLTRGASVNLAADQNVTVDAEINGLVAGGGGVTGGGLTLTAGNNLTVNQNIVLNNGALNLTATNGTLLQADGTVLYTGTGAANLRGGAGVNLGQVLSGGAVDIRSANGAVTVRDALFSLTDTNSVAPVTSLTINAQTGVNLAGAYAGSGGISVTAVAGNVISADATPTEGGLVSGGGITLRANAGQVGTSAAPLQLQATAGNVLLDGNTGVNVSTVLGRGTITFSAGAGSVTVSDVIAATGGTVSAATTDRPTSISITARDDVNLSGAIAGSGGISVDSSAGTLTLNDAWLLSSGPVTLAAQGAIAFRDGSGVNTTTSAGSVTVTSRNSTLTLGDPNVPTASAGIRADGDAANITLTSRGNLDIEGDIKAASGTIAIDSTHGAVRAISSYSSDTTDANSTLDAGNHGTRSIIDVHAAGDVELGEMIAYNLVRAISDEGNVVLKRGLGGGTVDGTLNTPVLTGFVNFADRYQQQYRPTVGRVLIRAEGGSVELNGLNLDGNADHTDTLPGLSVTASERIVSNRQIAVNKGSIVLAGGTLQETDGVYLGSSVYSRGYDPLGGPKVGYGIHITGRVLGLFDNTVEMAQLPVQTYRLAWYEAGPGSPPPLHDVPYADALGFVVDAAGLRVRNGNTYQQVGYLPDNPGLNNGSLSSAELAIYNVNADGTLVSNPSVRVVGVAGVPNAPVTQEIAKIEVSNNVANYQDGPNVGTLVPVTGGSAASRLVQIGTNTIAGVGNHSPGTPMRLSETISLVAPSQAPIVSAPTSSTVTAASRGIGLKVLGFEEAGDVSSFVWSSNVQTIFPDASPFFSARDDLSSDQVRPPNLSSLGLPSSLPSNGQFTVTAPVLATRTFTDSNGNTGTQAFVLPSNAGEAVLTFEAVNGSLYDVRLAQPPVLRNVNLAALANAPDPGAGYTLGPWVTSGWRSVGATADVRLVLPAMRSSGTANGVSVTASLYPAGGGSVGAQPVQSGGVLAPQFTLLAPDHVLPTPFAPEVQVRDQSVAPRVYTVTGSVADVRSTASIGSRVFVYDGIIDTAGGARAFDSNTGVVIPGLGGVPGLNNSTIGFAGIGTGFSVNGGSAGTTTVSGGGTVPGGQSGTGTAPAVEDRSAQDVAHTTLRDTGVDSALQTANETVFGARAAAQADLGRGGAILGSAVNVFKRRYRVATSGGAVCAPEALQQVLGEGQAVRECAANKQ
jgi:filamentous hemagglutinin family protein